MINPFYFLIDPAIYRDLLFFSIVILGVLSVLSLVAMIVHKTFIEIRETLSVQLKTLHHAQIHEFLNGARKGLPVTAAGISYDCLADAAIPILATVDAASAAKLRDELEKAGLLDHLVTVAATSRSWVRRYLALERLGFLKYRHLSGFFRDIVAERKDRRLLTKALWALSFVATAADVELIWSTLKAFELSSGKFQEYVCTNMVESFRQRHGDEPTVKILRILVMAKGEDPALRRAVVEACGKIDFPAFASVAVETFRAHDDDAMMRTASLRAAGALRAAGICDILCPAFADQDWRVRLVAAQYAGLCGDCASHRLEQLLRDSNYHIRINAARVLFTLGATGRSALERAIIDTDRFAADTARYVLAGR